MQTSSELLVAGDPNPTAVENLSGSSPFLLLGDHAGRAVPVKLGDLGVSPSDLERHIAWDIGVAGFGRNLAQLLNATFIHQRYSRLVIDCNRALDDENSIPSVSDDTVVPGNQTLTQADRTARQSEIFSPYHHRIDELIGARKRRGEFTLLVSLHSFTPQLKTQQRPWRFGVLHRGDSAFSSAVLDSLRRRFQAAVGDNQPYAMDGTDFTVPRHADGHGLDYLELEVRQDALADSAGQAEIAAIFSEVLQEVV